MVMVVVAMGWSGVGWLLRRKGRKNFQATKRKGPVWVQALPRQLGAITQGALKIVSIRVISHVTCTGGVAVPRTYPNMVCPTATVDYILPDVPGPYLPLHAFA